MLVQLSPWETAQTSIRLLPKSKRRRKRGEQSNSTEFSYSASFVAKSSSRRSRNKKNRLDLSRTTQSSDYEPLLAITSAHHVTVVGQNSKVIGADSPSLSTYEEISAMQYESRPGSTSSFYPTSQNGKSGTGLMPPIPALLDSKNDRVFAFQHQNTRLCCWNSLYQEGPDDKTSIKVELSQPAMSMHMLNFRNHDVLVYGTCQDGTLYIARVVEAQSDDISNNEKSKKETIAVEYISSSKSKKNSSGGLQYVGTAAEIFSSEGGKTNNKQSAGMKRKAKASDEKGISIGFYQIFYKEKSLSLIRQNVVYERDSRDGKLIIDSSKPSQSASVVLTDSLGGGSGGNGSINNASLLFTQSSEASSFPRSVVVTFSLEETPLKSENGSRNTKQGHYSATISLEHGKLLHPLVLLPPTTLHTGLLSENFLVAGTKDEVLLVDLHSGVTVQKSDLKDLIGDATDEWLIFTDPTKGLLTIVYPKDGQLNVSFATARLDESKKSMSETKMSLATKLSSSLLITGSDGNKSSPAPSVMKNLLLIGKNDCHKSDEIGKDMESSVQQALDTLSEAKGKIDSDDEKLEPQFFLKAYENAVSKLLGDLKSSDKGSKGIAAHYNPQDALPSSKHGKQKRGQNEDSVDSKHDRGAPGQSPLNGMRHDVQQHAQMRALSPSFLPQSFIDGALRITLSVLCMEKVQTTSFSKTSMFARLDARLILSRLLQTGKVSARRHFEGMDVSKDEHRLTSILRALKLTNKRGKRIFSPVDMMHDILRFCPDVSERQMVAMLDYMLCRALPDDVLEVFMESRSLHHKHPHKALSRRYIGLRKRHRNSSRDKTTEKKDRASTEDFQKVSTKLLIAGAELLLQQILAYSDVNCTILRAALLDGLGHGEEANLLARMLLHRLSSTPVEAVFSGHRHESKSKALCQWMSAVCDAFQGELSASAKSANGESFLSLMHRTVSTSVKQCEAVLSLQEDLNRTLLKVKSSSRRRKQEKEEEGNDDNDARERTSMQPEQEIPGYSVDQLVF